MPYEPLSLARTIQNVWDAYIENNPPEIMADEGEVAGVPDTMLWQDIRSSAGDSPADTLHGMSFDDAVVVDPRRIDAMIQQRVSGPMYKVNTAVSEAQNWTGHEDDREQLVRNESHLDRYQYLLRLHLIRQNHDGEIDAEGLAETFQLAWDSAGKILETSLKMARAGNTSELLWDAVAGQFDCIRRCLREACEIAERASRAAPDQDSIDAWERYVSILGNIEENYANGLQQRGHQLTPMGDDPEAYGGLAGRRIRGNSGDLQAFGNLGMTSWIQDRMALGHRTAEGAEASLGQWRRSGGRFF